MSAITIGGRRHVTRVPADYFRLVAEIPLRPIRTDGEYARAAMMLDRLSVRDDLTRGEQDYLDALTVFVEAFDNEHEPDLAADLSPLQMLNALMEHRGMTPSALGALLGSKGAASEILHGKRGISKTHMAKLAAHFGVDAGVFLERAGSARAQGK
jgi:HTH-type transcriptional regulator/antitoxin HigA